MAGRDPLVAVAGLAVVTGLPGWASGFFAAPAMGGLGALATACEAVRAVGFGGAAASPKVTAASASSAAFGTAMLSAADKDKAAASSQRNGRWGSMLMVNFLAGSMTGAF